MEQRQKREISEFKTFSNIIYFSKVFFSFKVLNFSQYFDQDCS